MLRCLAVLSLGALAACETVVSESTRDFVYEGATYELRTELIESSGRQFEHSAVRVNGQYYSCLPHSPGSCEGAVREAFDRDPGS